MYLSGWLCVYMNVRGVHKAVTDLYPPKSPKLDLTTHSEYVANLANVSVWLQTCNSAAYYTGVLYLHNDICLTDIYYYY